MRRPTKRGTSKSAGSTLFFVPTYKTIMQLPFAHIYKQLSDKEIVDKVVTAPYNEEAAVYLLFDRYNPLLVKIYRRVFDNSPDWYDDCCDDLFAYLKGNKMDWSRLRSFQWRCQFSSWIKSTAGNRFLEIKPYLIGKIPFLVSIDDEAHPVQLPDNGEEDYERVQLKILLLEAIRELEDSDQKFVVVKRLEGYNSQEIAELLKKAWEKHGVKRIDKGHEVIPSAAYVDVKISRAKVNLKEILSQMI